jgi:release factor glutamine methyltransferase
MALRRDDLRTSTVGHTWKEQLSWAEATLREAGSPSPQLDASVLLSWLVRAPSAALSEEPGHLLEEPTVAEYVTWVRRRAEGEPVAFITHHKFFMGLDLYVDRRALLVRPFTQLVVELVLEMARVRPETRLTAADIGTGCGALAVALASLEPKLAPIYATDYSGEALEVARTNGTRYRMEGRIHWLEGDLLSPLPEPVDYIVANLPYIPDSDPGVARGVVRYEPHVALFGGADGLALVRRCIAQVPNKLRAGGALVLEVGPGQRPAVEALIRQAMPAARVRAYGAGQLKGATMVAQL